MSSYLCEQLLTYFEEESQVIRDECKHHSEVDESSSKQQIYGSVSIIFVVRKTGPILLVLVGLIAARQNMGGFQSFKNSL